MYDFFAPRTWLPNTLTDWKFHSMDQSLKIVKLMGGFEKKTQKIRMKQRTSKQILQKKNNIPKH